MENDFWVARFSRELIEGGGMVVQLVVVIVDIPY
jgi:hypothetical protein